MGNRICSCHVISLWIPIVCRIFAFNVEMRRVRVVANNNNDHDGDDDDDDDDDDGAGPDNQVETVF